MPRGRKLPINCAARNAVWVYPRAAPPRFPRAPVIVETTRSYRKHDLSLSTLPECADVAVKLYERAYALRLDGESHRVYIHRFHYA